MKALLTILILCSMGFVTHADETISADWMKDLSTLSSGMSRVQAENVIEKVRGVKSTYDLYSMDINRYVTYKLDDKHILLVIYEPGIPAAHVTSGAGHPPQDGEVIEFKVLVVK